MASPSTLNPIIPGFAPDPSLVLVDGTYFLVNSTFHLEEKSHLVATGGLYAPTLRYHNDIFYIVCTNVVHQSLDGSSVELQNFIVSTTDILASKWSNPVYFDFYGIDPSLFFGTDGKAYLCGSKSPGPDTKIILFEIDVKTGKKLTEEKELWHGTGGIYPEGPHIYLRNSFYYLMVAEGGTHEGHSVTMARSTNIWGPYEPSPLNPILSAAGTKEYIQATGHCEAFEDKNGEWWGVCLGIRQGAVGLWGLGRETFLTKGHWNEHGWLSFDRASLHIEGFRDVQQDARLTVTSEADMLYIHDPELFRYEISGGNITLTPSEHDITSPEASPTFIGKRQRLIKGASTVTLLNTGLECASSSLFASFVVYKDEHRSLRISYTPSKHTISLQVLNEGISIDRTTTKIVDEHFEKLNIRIQYTELEYSLYYGLDGSEVKELGKVSTMDLSNKDFTGPIVGVHAVSESSSEDVKIHFEDFVVDGA
ncbi:glycosyl hydrolase [Phaeosphaeria sp. MPI-PUGE-AT-0046c]|nr:glycosyl hydrolase [Phaeosphaeria sp. MPI-PUGE-AT-0046c]